MSRSLTTYRDRFGHASKMRTFLRPVICAGFLLVAPLALADALSDAARAVQNGEHRQAIQLLTPIANDGNALAQHRLGLLHYHGQGTPEDERLAVTWWKKAAGQGNAEAMFLLGNAYLLGTQAPKLVSDPDREAAKWYFQAASSGHAEAQYMLAHLFLAGKGVVESRAEASNWFRKAAAQGHDEAGRALGSVNAGR